MYKIIAGHKTVNEIIISQEEMKDIKYEITKLDREKRKKKQFSFNYMIRRLKRIDFTLIPQVCGFYKHYFTIDFIMSFIVMVT